MAKSGRVYPREMSMKHRPLKWIVVALAGFSMAGAACAQYVWLNERGIKQYSDLPPPASVPQSRILKMPGGAGAQPATTEAGDRAAVSSNQVGAPLSTADKNADFLKRRADQAQKEKKAAEVEKIAATKAQNCDRARNYQRSLDLGERISSVDKNGERSYLSDEERVREQRDTRRILDDCK